MYLRETKRRNKDGSVVRYLQLAHSIWDTAKQRSQTKIIYNFGRADQLDRAVLVRLCQSIARLCDIDIVDTPAVARNLPDEVGLPDGLLLVGATEFGIIYLVEQLCQNLGITAILHRLAQQHGVNDTIVTAIIALLANRLHRPTSKRGVYLRWLDEVHAPQAAALGRNTFYHALDFLHEHADAIEHDVFFAVADLFNLEVDLVFYDTTTAAFTVDDPDEDGPRQRGRNKGGGYKVQVVVALAVTRQGIPVRSWVLPGNTADVATITQIRSDLRGWKLSRVVLVADAGMDSADNRAELARACGRYVLAVRAGRLSEVQGEVLSRPGRYQTVGDSLRVKEVVVGDGARRRRYIVCHNPKQEARQKAHRAEVIAELEETLAARGEARTDRKWVAQLRASQRYGRYLRVSKGGKVRIDRRAVRRASRLDGKWVLLTNDDTLSAMDTALAYKGLMVIEGCFRSLKSAQIELEPLHHRLEVRIGGHVKLCVLALLLQRVIELRGELPYGQVLPLLRQLKAAHFQTPTHNFWHLNQVPSRLQALFNKLDVPRPAEVVGIQERAEDPDEA